MGRKKIEQLEDIPVSKKGVILQNKLMDVIYGKKVSTRDKSAVSPSALYTASHSENSGPKEAEFNIDNHRERLKRDNKELWYVVKFMSVTGCRVSEAINIRPTDITENGRVRLIGLKNSNDRIVVDSELSDYFIYCKKVNKPPFGTFDRHFIYRRLKYYGIGDYFGDSQRKSVTHLFRHLAIKDMAGVDKGLNTTKVAIGHKSLSNTEHYAHAKKRKNSN